SVYLSLILMLLHTLCITLSYHFFPFLFFSLRLPPTSTLFPYTTLFRSCPGLPQYHRHLSHRGRHLHRELHRQRPHSHRRCDPLQDRKSTRLNSSHVSISYAVFCLKKKNTQPI